MERYFELGIYNGEKSDGTGVCGKYKSFDEASKAIAEFTKEDNHGFTDNLHCSIYLELSV